MNRLSFYNHEIVLIIRATLNHAYLIAIRSGCLPRTQTALEKSYGSIQRPGRTVEKRFSQGGFPKTAEGGMGEDGS